jgi:hypothetical protein
VNRSRDNFFTNTTLACDEYLGVGSSDPIDFLFERCNFRAASSQLDVRSRPHRTDWANSRAAFSDTINHCS